MNIELELKQLEEEITACKSERAKAEGSIETLMKRLKDEEGIGTLEDAEKILKELEKTIASLESNIELKLNELKEIYTW
jgi:predicted  nucleic acid-binding Zn-ribbon protein